MDKLQMAHDWFIASINNGKHVTIEQAWSYADAMQAEAEKRNKAEAAQKRKEIREMLNADNTFIEREGQHFDDVANIQKPYTSPEDCKVDWSQASDYATHYVIFADGLAYWYKPEKLECFDIAPSFGIVGMCVVERPNGF